MSAEPRTLAFREALREAMVEEMERDGSIFLMGEEVGHYHGAYKVSEGMIERFGERRVVDTPIAETGFAGVGIGAAMVGLRPIIEFMTWNFSLVAANFSRLSTATSCVSLSMRACLNAASHSRCSISMSRARSCSSRAATCALRPSAS